MIARYSEISSQILSYIAQIKQSNMDISALAIFLKSRSKLRPLIALIRPELGNISRICVSINGFNILDSWIARRYSPLSGVVPVGKIITTFANVYETANWVIWGVRIAQPQVPVCGLYNGITSDEGT